MTKECRHSNHPKYGTLVTVSGGPLSPSPAVVTDHALTVMIGFEEIKRLKHQILEQHFKVVFSKANARWKQIPPKALCWETYRYHQRRPAGPATMMSAIHRLLVEYIQGEEFRCEEWLKGSMTHLPFRKTDETKQQTRAWRTKWFAVLAASTFQTPKNQYSHYIYSSHLRKKEMNRRRTNPDCARNCIHPECVRSRRKLTPCPMKQHWMTRHLSGMLCIAMIVPNVKKNVDSTLKHRVCD